MKPLILCAVLVAAAFSQSRQGKPDGTPNNNWPIIDYQVFPDDQGTYRGCASFVDGSGVIHFAKNIPVSVSTYVTQYSGWHGHEVFPITSAPRPQPVWLGVTSGITGDNGCFAVTFELPGIAGWYTFEAVIAGQTVGTNVYVWYGSPNPFSRLAAADHLIPYPDNPVNNVSQSLHHDPLHGPQTIPAPPATRLEYTRFVQRGIDSQLSAASIGYRQSSGTAGVIDRADIVRCSLPDGGLSDNQSYDLGAAMTWSTQVFEEHAKGNECDVINPKATLDLTHAVLLMQAMIQQSCGVGAFAPDGVAALPDRVGFWLDQSYLHMVCANTRLLSSPRGPR